MLIIIVAKIAWEKYRTTIDKCALECIGKIYPLRECRDHHLPAAKSLTSSNKRFRFLGFC
jgi:hypothetical protein